MISLFSSEGNPARSHLNVLVAHNDDPQDRLIVRFVEARIGMPEARGFCQNIQDEDQSSIVLVVKSGITTFARRVIS